MVVSPSARISPPFLEEHPAAASMAPAPSTAATINADLFLPLLFISSFSPLSFEPLRLQTAKKRRPFNSPCFYYKGSVRISQAREDILSYIFMTFYIVFIKTEATQSRKKSKIKNTRRQSAGGNEKAQRPNVTEQVKGSKAKRHGTNEKLKDQTLRSKRHTKNASKRTCPKRISPPARHKSRAKG